MTHRTPAETDLAAAHEAVLTWFDAHARDLPWRAQGTSAWAVLVSEIMSQQTPVARVVPRWRDWMARWPAPSDLAAAPTAEVLRAWDSLGYPRRALRLKECAAVIAAEHGDRVPCDEETLRALPGIGAYTAAAVASFACGRRTTVLDVNIRRVLARVFDGHAHPKGALTKSETAWAAQFVPADGSDACHVAWNAGVMELGALVCTSRNPACEVCPLAEQCRWLAAGRPAGDDPARKPKTQAWHGTDRQLRGAIMAVLKAAEAPVARDLLTASATEFDGGPDGTFDAQGAAHEAVETAILRVRELGDGQRIGRLIDALIADGLAAEGRVGLHLPH